MVEAHDMGESTDKVVPPVNGSGADCASEPVGACAPLCVLAGSPAFDGAAQTLAERLGLAFSPTAFEGECEPLALVLDEDGLSLRGNGMTVRGDFTRLEKRVAPGNLPHELVVRAARVKGVDAPRAIDATAGLGEDSFLLAAAGFSVELFERDLVIAALLEDALARARRTPSLAAIAQRMSLTVGDSIPALANLDSVPDVVLLDPMFPEKQKSSRAKKKLQLMQLLEPPSPDERELLEAARAARPRKIVIKRPVKGPYLAHARPSYSLNGKAVRYDIIAMPSTRPE